MECICKSNNAMEVICSDNINVFCDYHCTIFNETYMIKKKEWFLQCQTNNENKIKMFHGYYNHDNNGKLLKIWKDKSAAYCICKQCLNILSKHQLSKELNMQNFSIYPLDYNLLYIK